MALFINGVEQSSITIDGVTLDSLYIDGVQVLNAVKFSMKVTSPTQPSLGVSGGTLQYTDNGDGTWQVYSNDAVTRVFASSNEWAGVTKVAIEKSSTLTSCLGMFYNASDMLEYDLTAMDTSNVNTMAFMFGGNSKILGIDMRYLDFSNVTDFGRMFENNSLMTCISNIDTTNPGASKTGMFDGCTSLLYPDQTDQTDIADTVGADWVNPGACPIVVQMIETQNGYCEFNDGGTCTTPSLISSIINGSYTTAIYSWVVIGATIDGSNTEDYIIVTTPQGNTDVTYTVQLTVIIDGVEYYVENDYTQVKTLAPIRITGISQDISGSCDPT